MLRDILLGFLQALSAFVPFPPSPFILPLRLGQDAPADGGSRTAASELPGEGRLAR